MKFKKKPIIVEANQFDSGLAEDIPGVEKVENLDGPGVTYLCHTAHGPLVVDDHDWIIKDVKEDFYYPCKPEIFDELFEPVLDGLVEDKDTKESFPTSQMCPKCKTNYMLTNRKNQKWCSWSECGYGRQK